MLPIITVGLTAAGRAAVERIPGGRTLHHYDTAEDALWSMGNEVITGETGDPVEPVQFDTDGLKWFAHVIYGDDAIGPLLTHTKFDTRAVEVPATGLVMVVTDTLGDDQFVARRVVDGTPEEREVHRQSVAAVALLHAQAFLAVDQLAATPHWPQAIEHQLNRSEETRPTPPPVAELAREASAQVAQLNAMIKRGEHRPGFFEDQGRRR